MTVKAIFEDGVFKPKEPVALDERTEVELEVRTSESPSRAEADPRSFVGLIKGGISGLPVAAHHDKFLDQGQYAFLKAFFRPLAKAADWAALSREQRIERFARACEEARPDLQDLWDDMDRIPLVWSNAFDYCARAIEREAVARHG
jgi:predicted DNA-binding antitoxin AbrB/MazE fold protein